MDRIIFCVFLGEDLDVYSHLLPRYFPSPDKYDQELESTEQQEDANEEGNLVKEKEKKELHEGEGEGEATEKSATEDETTGLFALSTPKCWFFSLCLKELCHEDFADF